MHTVLDINGWEQRVAESEAVLLRESVRGALASGAGLQATLEMVRRRLLADGGDPQHGGSR